MKWLAAWLVNEPPPDPPRQPAPTDPQRLGEHAKRLLDDPVLNLALDRIGEKIAGSWRNSKAGDSETREAAYRLHWVLEQFRAELRAMVGNAKVIEAEKLREAAKERRAA